MVQRLGVGVDGRAQARQRLVPGLGQQSEVEGGKLLKMPDVLEQVAILGALLVDEGHRRGGRAHFAHGDASFHTHSLHIACPT